MVQRQPSWIRLVSRQITENQSVSRTQACMSVSLTSERFPFASILLLGSTAPRDFTFDFSYWSFDPSAPHFATNPKVYSDLGVSVLNNAWGGFNCCLFATVNTTEVRGVEEDSRRSKNDSHWVRLTFVIAIPFIFFFCTVMDRQVQGKWRHDTRDISI